MEHFMQNKNILKISDYISKGCKKNQSLGLELEHFIVSKITSKRIPYFNGINAVMDRLCGFFEVKTYSEGFLIGLANDDYSITLEPGAQLEISITPQEKLSNINRIYNDFLSLVTPILDDFEYELKTFGYTPNEKAADIPLIPKKRYEYMDRYFKTTGTMGINMMRATASTQCSIDFSDERDFVNKFRFASIISPILSLITDNCPSFDGTKQRMARTLIWQNTDNCRCGTVPTIFDKDFGFYKYGEYIYNIKPIFTAENMEYTGQKKAAEIYAGRDINEDIITHLLSMVFPDVRAKQYIEIRPADSMDIDMALAYSALIKGLMKNPDYDFGAITVSDIYNTKNTLIKDGFAAIIYNRNVKEIIEDLLKLAKNNLSDDEKYLVEPFYNLLGDEKN